jgi:hypothetical protein
VSRDREAVGPCADNGYFHIGRARGGRATHGDRSCRPAQHQTAKAPGLAGSGDSALKVVIVLSIVVPLTILLPSDQARSVTAAVRAPRVRPGMADNADT